MHVIYKCNKRGQTFFRPQPTFLRCNDNNRNNRVLFIAGTKERKIIAGDLCMKQARSDIFSGVVSPLPPAAARRSGKRNKLRKRVVIVGYVPERGSCSSPRSVTGCEWSGAAPTAHRRGYTPDYPCCYYRRLFCRNG